MKISLRSTLLTSIVLLALPATAFAKDPAAGMGRSTPARSVSSSGSAAFTSRGSQDRTWVTYSNHQQQKTVGSMSRLNGDRLAMWVSKNPVTNVTTHGDSFKNSRWGQTTIVRNDPNKGTTTKTVISSQVGQGTTRTTSVTNHGTGKRETTTTHRPAGPSPKPAQ